MQPFCCSIFCEKHQTETCHTVIFDKYEKGNAILKIVCDECTKEAVENGEEEVDCFILEMPTDEFFKIIPFDDYCELEN